MVPSRAWLTPLPACGVPVTMSGGHAAAHAPVHADVPFLSAWNRYRVRPLLPTRALTGIPEMAASDTVAVPLAWLVAAGLLDGAAAAGIELAGLDAAVPGVDVLEPLEQAAASRPIPAAAAALAIRCVMVVLPLRHLARLGPRLPAPRVRHPAEHGCAPLLTSTG